MTINEENFCPLDSRVHFPLLSQCILVGHRLLAPPVTHFSIMWTLLQRRAQVSSRARCRCKVRAHIFIIVDAAAPCLVTSLRARATRCAQQLENNDEVAAAMMKNNRLC